MKTRKVTLSGGYHNVDDITIRVPHFGKLDDGVTIVDYIDSVITDNQRRRLERHFCGIQGCTCGS
jgi:hypothetical protein